MEEATAAPAGGVAAVSTASTEEASPRLPALEEASAVLPTLEEATSAVLPTTEEASVAPAGGEAAASSCSLGARVEKTPAKEPPRLRLDWKETAVPVRWRWDDTSEQRRPPSNCRRSGCHRDPVSMPKAPSRPPLPPR